MFTTRCSPHSFTSRHFHQRSQRSQQRGGMRGHDHEIRHILAGNHVHAVYCRRYPRSFPIRECVLRRTALVAVVAHHAWGGVVLLHDSYRFPHLSFTRRRRLALLQHLGRASRFPLQVQTDSRVAPPRFSRPSTTATSGCGQLRCTWVRPTSNMLRCGC